MEINGKNITTFPAKFVGAPLVVMIGSKEEGEKTYALRAADYSLAVIDGVDWERELTPWACPPPAKRMSPFSGEADGFLSFLTNAALPQIKSALPRPGKAVICGYSLAGLFALYAACRSGVFDGAASVSGSLWFPGFTDFLKKTPPLARSLYLSVGDAEANTKNPVLRTVEENTAAVFAFLNENGYDAVYVKNPGGHFTDPEKRLAAGIESVVSRL